MNECKKKRLTPEQKADYHGKLCNEFHQIYLDKNDDYGDAFAKLWQEVGFLTGYTKIADKFYRIQSLRNKGEENRKVGETIRDSLMDLANYCMLSVMEMDITSGKADGYKPISRTEKCPKDLTWAECALDAKEAANACPDCPFIAQMTEEDKQ